MVDNVTCVHGNGIPQTEMNSKRDKECLHNALMKATIPVQSAHNARM